MDGEEDRLTRTSGPLQGAFLIPPVLPVVLILPSASTRRAMPQNSSQWLSLHPLVSARWKSYPTNIGHPFGEGRTACPRGLSAGRPGPLTSYPPVAPTVTRCPPSRTPLGSRHATSRFSLFRATFVNPLDSLPVCIRAGSSSATDTASRCRHPRDPPSTRTGGLAPP